MSVNALLRIGVEVFEVREEFNVTTLSIHQTGCGYSLHNSVTPQQQELVFQINFFQ